VGELFLESKASTAGPQVNPIKEEPVLLALPATEWVNLLAGVICIEETVRELGGESRRRAESANGKDVSESLRGGG
jgi:hypothetical protein